MLKVISICPQEIVQLVGIMLNEADVTSHLPPLVRTCKNKK
jgi:hypothetical protein